MASSSSAQSRWLPFRLRPAACGRGLLRRVRQRPWAAALVAGGLLLVAGLGYYVIAPQVHGYRHWSRAQQALQRHELDEAQAHLEKCLTVWPDNAEVHFALARTYRRSGDLSAARRHLQRADQLGWPTEATDLEYLLLRAQSGELNAVRPVLVPLLQARHPEEVAILETLAQVALDRHLIDEAVRWATVWTERYPEDWRPRFVRGLALEAYVLAAADEKAIKDYERVLELKPDHAEARYKLGDLLRRTGQYKAALSHLEACYRQNPEDSRVVVSLARCLLYLRQASAAKALLDEWLAKHPEGEADVFLVRGQADYDLGEPEKALPWLRRAEQLAAKDEDTFRSLANTLRRLGQHDEAARYDRLAKDFHKQIERLRTLLRDIRANPDAVAPRYEAGIILLRTGHEREGVRWLHSVLDIDPRHAATHQTLADYYEKVNDLERARVHRAAAGP
jgi:tetratricopeptide (TPR) repeat protein